MKIFLTKFPLFLFLLLALSFAFLAHANQSGVESIIEKDLKDEAIIGETTVRYEPNTITITGSADEVLDDMSDFEDEDSFINLDVSIEKMKSSISGMLGEPDSSPLVLLLFSLAALLQMARVATGQSNWLNFVVRVLLVLIFLRGYSSLFSGVEMFFSYLGQQILGGESAYQVFWKSQDAMITHITAKWDQAWNNGAWDLVKAMVSKDSFFYAIVLLSHIFSYALYILIYLVQSCILIALQYLGPMLIALAIIPETDFSQSFVTSLFQVLSWTIIVNLLIKIMATIPVIQFSSNPETKDFIVLTAMHVCFALAFVSVPKISEMVFSGRGWGSLGGAVTSFGKMALAATGGFIAGRSLGLGRGATKALGGVGWGVTKKGLKGADRLGGKMVSPVTKPVSQAVKNTSASIKSSVKNTSVKAYDHMKRVTPGGRAAFNKKYYPNSGYGHNVGGGNAITIAKGLDQSRKTNLHGH